MKEITVYALYGGAVNEAARRLLESGSAFHFTGEYLYSARPWDEVLDGLLGDLRSELIPVTERWSTENLGFREVKR